MYRYPFYFLFLAKLETYLDSIFAMTYKYERKYTN